MADGATQTSFSSLWAKLLVKEVVHYSPSDNKLIAGVDRARKAWGEYLEGIDLPWHAIEKVKKGAFSSLLWFHLKGGDNTLNTGGTWKAISIGDSNLFQIRNRGTLISFPIKKSEDFGNSPHLISSKVTLDVKLINTQRGRWILDDQFILATDALACFLLKLTEVDADVGIEVKKNCQSKDQFSAWINNLREQKIIKNDDTSIIFIQMQNPIL